MTAVLIMVTVEDHPVRDEWVDKQAVRGNVTGQGFRVPFDPDALYRGVWLVPQMTPGVGPVPFHVFALPDDVPVIERAGYVRKED